MVLRCCECGHLKLLGIGWVRSADRLYCPKCWNWELWNQKQLAEDMIRWERIRDIVENYKQVIKEQRKELEIYSSGKIRVLPHFQLELMPPEVAVPCIGIAQLGLERIRQQEISLEEEMRRVLKDKKYHLLLFTNRCKEGANHVESVASNISAVFGGIKLRKLSENVSSLINLCLLMEKITYISPLHIIGQLGTIDPTTTLDHLCKIAGNSHANSQSHITCIIALCKIGTSPALDALLRVLNSGNWPIVGSTVLALIDLKDERVVMPIIKAIRQDRYSKWAKITEPLVEFIRPRPELLQEIYHAWRTTPKSQERPIGSTTRWEDCVSVLEVVLIKCGGCEAVEIAARWAQSNVEEFALKGTEALADLDYEQSTDALCEILCTVRSVIVDYYDSGDMWGIPDYGPNTKQRIAAAKALAKRGGLKAMAALQRASDTNDKVRETITQLLSDMSLRE